MGLCKTCGRSLRGRQRAFCSRPCKNGATNQRHQSYSREQTRGRARKLELIRLLGGACRRCGYRRNHAAMAFHHKVASLKSFELDLRSLSNRTWDRILGEVEKCELVCSNCHAEIHHPECAIAV